MELESPQVGTLQLICGESSKNQEGLWPNENMNFSSQHQLRFPSNLLTEDDDGRDVMKAHMAYDLTTMQSGVFHLLHVKPYITD